jgi:hypothetical protein
MKKLGYKLMFWDVLVGCVFVLFNFNGFMRFAAKNWVPASSASIAAAIVQISHWPDVFVPAQKEATLALLGGLLHLCFFGLWIYLAAIVILSLVRLRPGIAANGLLGLTAGLLSIAIITWSSSILAFVVRLLITVGVFVFGVLASVLNFLLPILGWIVIVLAIGAAVLGIGWAIYQFWRRYGLWGVAGTLAGGFLLFFIWPLLVRLYESIILPALRWLGSILAYLAGLVAFLLGWLIKIVLVVAVIVSAIGLFIGFVGSMGHLLIDQVKAAWRSGSGQRGILLGSFAVGLSVVLIVWVSSGSVEMTRVVDNAWKGSTFLLSDASPVRTCNALLPTFVVTLGPTMFQTANAPVFDAVVLLLVLLVSYIGILRGMRPRQEDSFRTIFVSQDLLKLGGLMFLALPIVAVTLLAALAPKED